MLGFIYVHLFQVCVDIADLMLGTTCEQDVPPSPRGGYAWRLVPLCIMRLALDCLALRETGRPTFAVVDDSHGSMLGLP